VTVVAAVVVVAVVVAEVVVERVVVLTVVVIVRVTVDVLTVDEVVELVDVNVGDVVVVVVAVVVDDEEDGGGVVVVVVVVVELVHIALSFARVAAPTKPVPDVRPSGVKTSEAYLFWNLTTAALVKEPKYVDSLPGEPAPDAETCVSALILSAFCKFITSAPV